MPAIDLPQVRALVASVRTVDDRGRVALAVRAHAGWAGSSDPATLEDGMPLRVLPCPSPLAVRAALVDHTRATEDEVLVLLTPCKDGDLGPDVLARLAKNRILSVNPFEAVLTLFRATVLDPELTGNERWLIDQLIELAPPGGWPADRPPSGVLDVELAWKVWHRARLGDDAAVADTLDDVLRMADAPNVGAALAALSAEHRARVGHRWAGGAPAAAVMAELAAAGRGADVLALGLVVDVLWAATDDPALAGQQTVARVRMEPLLGRDRLDAQAAAAWADAAVALMDEVGVATTVIDRAEGLLREVGAEPLQVLSDQLRAGFDLRLDALAGRLTAGDVPGAEAALVWLRRHRFAHRRAAQLAAAEAAVRLLRRRQSPPPSVRTFADQVHQYAADGAWVDDARRRLSEGDTRPQVAAAYTALCADIDGERRARDLAFATNLAEWAVAEPSAHAGFVPVEQLLERVVVPVAADAPVLVLLCDGMGLPAAHELLTDLAHEGWTPAVPAGAGEWPVGVAMLPTVTDVSRTSLLCGARLEGGQAQEKPGFAGHAGLRRVSAGQKTPVLFHNAELAGPSGVALAEPVRAALADPTQRVVGVVVNAIDDLLAKNHQVNVGWTLDSLKAVRWVLDAAEEAQRVIVLTADHGHVLHGDGAEYRRSGDGGGERWRTPATPAGEGEVEVSGPRVLKGGHVVLPADERIRYAAMRTGYHGGATLQEVLVPVTVLARMLPDEWERRPLTPPAWWDGAVSAAAAAPTPAVALAPRRRVSMDAAQSMLFEPEPIDLSAAAPAGGDWVDWVAELLASPTFVAQRERVRLPRPMPNERIASYLREMRANGGTIGLAALAARVGEPADQLRMALTLVQRLVNVDGAEVMAVRADSIVELNRELLSLQFEVAVP